MNPISGNLEEKRTFAQRAWRFLIVYGLWLVFSAMTFFAWANLLQVIEGLFFGQVNPWQLRSIRQFGAVILGIVWLIALLASEAYYRKFLNPKKKLFLLVRLTAIAIGITALIRAANAWIN